MNLHHLQLSLTLVFPEPLKLLMASRKFKPVELHDRQLD